MPEGDSIARVAADLREAFEGRVLAGGRLRDYPEVTLAGRRVERVSAHGKHLFVELDSGLEVRSHLGMYGRWRRYRPDPGKRPSPAASIVLRSEHDVWVCYRAMEVECLRVGSLAHRDARRRLGPNLAAASAELDGVAARARALFAPDTPILDVLLDQRVTAGIGNVYKSEVLFIERVHPLTSLGEMDDDGLAALFATAHRLIHANAARGGHPRVTRTTEDGRGDKWVYERARRPCLRCNTPVSTQRLGKGLRSTYWCPRCQRARGVRPPAP